MILRIVKMHFKQEDVEHFLNYFESIRTQIESMPGMLNLKLYQDDKDNKVLFTISSWLNEQHLNNYRKSELFGVVWPKTKAMFAENPEAWSLKLK